MSSGLSRRDGDVMSEQIPQTWDDDRDGPFFRITAHLLECPVLEAVSCLLAANDEASLR